MKRQETHMHFILKLAKTFLFNSFSCFVRLFEIEYESSVFFLGGVGWGEDEETKEYRVGSRRRIQ